MTLIKSSRKILLKRIYMHSTATFYIMFLYIGYLYFFISPFKTFVSPGIKSQKKLLDTEQNSWTRSSRTILTKYWQPPSSFSEKGKAIFHFRYCSFAILKNLNSGKKIPKKKSYEKLIYPQQTFEKTVQTSWPSGFFQQPSYRFPRTCREPLLVVLISTKQQHRWQAGKGEAN